MLSNIKATGHIGIFKWKLKIHFLTSSSHAQSRNPKASDSAPGQAGQVQPQKVSLWTLGSSLYILPVCVLQFLRQFGFKVLFLVYWASLVAQW